ncbi:MAG: 4Fe-4S dicluster domain-containing protein [Chthoniobacterales bacterium]|nr:4Fe-4S dicluster domain-containing protein [Chthoniobacterales bacterium]
MNFPGIGLLKGFVVTARNFLGSYVEKDRLTTRQYPEERPKLPENSRSFPFLVFDGEDPEAGMRCVACKICEKECPPQCIYIIQDRDAAGKPLKRPRIFDIDISVCMSCQICVEVCPFESIRMDTDYELSSFDRFGSLVLDKSKLLKSNAYYHGIHPTEASETDARIEADRKKKEAAAAAKAEAARKATAEKAAKAAHPPEETK